MHRVCLIQRVLPHYRICFVRQLRERLWERGIELRLIYGQERAGTVPRTVPLNEPWTHAVNNRYTNVGQVELVWQPCLAAVGGSDLIIVEQSNRLLINHLLQLRRLWSRRRLAFWGHGRNFQSRAPGSLRERLKKRLLGGVDWWFAYTDLTRQVLAEAGFPGVRVTAVNNAIDDTGLREGMRQLAGRGSLDVARSLGCDGSQVALYCGGLHQGKRVDFLLRAAERIKASLPDFELLVVGDGPERGTVERAASNHCWIHYAGMKSGADLAPYLHAAKVLLMPGPVGLVVLDSFIGGCPLITTDIPHHGPEIAYLQSGVNGVMTRDDLADYAAGVVACMTDDERLRALQDECRLSAEHYSMSAMVDNFATGIERCLRQS